MSLRLSEIAHETAPLLEGALRDEEDARFDAELQLRGTVCGLATAALQLFWLDQYGVNLTRRRATPEEAPRGLNSRRLSHITLFDGDDMVDPTYGQFFAYVGLSREAAQARQTLRTLYPAQKIAVFPAAEAASFADVMASHMQAIEPEVAVRRPADLPVYPPDGSLAGTSLDKKREVLRDIWQPESYHPFPLEDQTASFRRRALRLAERMYELEAQRA